MVGEAVPKMSIIEQVARHLWGDPNKEGEEWLRWGNRGSRCVNPATERWADHEHGQSGDVLDMIMFNEMFDQHPTRPDAEAWLWNELHLKYERPTVEKPPNGYGHFWDYITAVYKYVDETGALLFEVCRIQMPGEAKTFRPRDASGGWGLKGKGIRHVLYNLPEVLAAKARGDTIYIVEGEKDVENLRKLGIVATTNPSGANKWRKEYNAFLQNARVVIIPDNDEAGRQHANTVRSNLPGARVLELKGLPDKGDVSDWIEAGGTREGLEELLTSTYAEDVWTLPQIYMQGDVDPLAARRWLIKNVLPEIGHGVLSGQWGTYKTFMVLELAYSIMTGNAFAKRFKVKRRSGVLLIAAEGASEVAVRLEALAREKCGGARQPFAWIEETPRLLEADAIVKLKAIIEATNERMLREHGVPIGLVVIDTLIIAAGYERAGEENDASIGARLQDVLKAITVLCGVCLLGVDHFGKDASVGTRGTSVKETNPDFVLSLLGKEVDGSVKDPRLNVRKVRGARAGFEIGFSVEIVVVGQDEDDDPVDTLVIQWGEGTAAPREDRWPKNLKLLNRCLVEVISENGEPLTLPNGTKTPRAADSKAVRELFYERHPASGDTPKKQQHARLVAFNRALKDAQAHGLIDVHNTEDCTFAWIRE
jgi:hypothetical protein